MASSQNYFQQSLGCLVPPADQQAFKIAFYNTISLVFLIAVSFLLLGIYHLLQAFFRPIVWAVLCGTVLFPFKKTVASCTESWLDDLKESNTPFLIGLVLIPARIVDRSASALWKLVSSKDVMIFVAVYALFVGLAYQNVFNKLLGVSATFYSFIDNFITFGSSKWALILTLAYFLAFIGYLYAGGQDLHKTPTRFLSVPIWVVLLCLIANFSGFFRVIVFGISSIVILLIVLRVIGNSDNEKEHNQQENDKEKKEEKLTEQIENESSSNKYIYIIFGGCCLVWIMQSPVVLIVFIVVLIYGFMKKLGQYFGIWSLIWNSAISIFNFLHGKFSNIVNIVIPSSIRKFAKLMYYGDQHVIDTFKSSAGVLSSIIVMICLVFGLISMSVFFAFQLRDEATHLVRLTGNLLNRTISSNPQYADWLNNATNLGGGADQLDAMVDDAFKYGRNWLGSQARLLAKADDQDKADQLEAQVKMLVDRVYDIYLSKSVTTLPAKHTTLDLWTHVKLTTDVSLLGNELMALIKENVGMLLSVLDTVWSVLSANLQFVFSLLFAFIGVILGLGLEVLNFIIGTLVFFTMMYYLLVLSKDEWKPIEWIKLLTPQSTVSSTSDNLTSFSNALEQAVSSVFILSFKMATFYGLYAYFIHTLFSLNVVFMPSILAAVFAAIPFLAPYWVFLPGALELFLIRGELASAILFFLFALAPMMFVDAEFYKEVKGSHPYMTGLSVVGGIYWLGLEGALIGPMMLCCMLVTLNMYRSMLPK